MQYPRILTARARAMGYSVPVIYAGPLKVNVINIVGDQEKARREYKPSSEWESRYKLGSLTLTAKRHHVTRHKKSGRRVHYQRSQPFVW